MGLLKLQKNAPVSSINYFVYIFKEFQILQSEFLDVLNKSPLTAFNHQVNNTLGIAPVRVSSIV